MANRKSKAATKRAKALSAESQIKKLDRKTADLLTGVGLRKATPPKAKTLLNVYIGAIDTLSWSQGCHSGDFCSNEVWIDTESTLSLYKDKDCKESAGLVAIYNGGRVGQNSSLLATAIAAYLAKAPVGLHYTESHEPYARGHGRLQAVMRLWFRRCTPCGCQDDE